MIVLFVGSTFSYWQWNSNNIVSISLVTDTGAQVGLTLDGGSNYSQNTVLIEWNYTIPRNSGTSSNNIEETYYLYYWLDSSYEFTNIGDNVVSDPLENINFSMSWSGSDLVELS